MDVNELRELAKRVTGWSSCNAAWLDSSEDVPAAVVGRIDDDGNEYPVAVVDCEQYYSDDSLALASFYAAANPTAILELLDRLEAAERDANRLDTLEAMLRKSHYPTHHKAGFAMVPRAINAKYCCYMTLSEAIDAAREGTK